MINVTFSQLEIFIQVARRPNLREVSKNIGLSHSAISMAISALESSIGGTLFNRIKNRLILNNRGLYLLENVAPLLLQIEDQLLLLKNGEISGCLRLGASSTIGNYLLPKIIGKFNDKYKNQVDIQLIIENTASIEKKLLQHELDVALIEGPILNQNLLKITPWIEDELIIVSNRKYTQTKAVFLKELAGTNWVLREKGSGTLSVFEKVLRKQSIILNRKLTMGHTEAIKQAVEAGLGISCLSKISVQKELFYGSLSKIFIKEDLSRTLTIITPKNRYQTRAQTAFIKFLLKK